MIIKKFILIISAVVIAFNTESKEMTIDLLAGNWVCTPILEQFGDINHDLSGLHYTDVSKENSIGETKWSYIKVGNNHMKSISLDVPDPLDDTVIMFMPKLNSTETIDDGVITSFLEYKYVNDDEMIATNNYEELHYDANKKLNSNSFGYKYQDRCLRIK